MPDEPYTMPAIGLGPCIWRMQPRDPECAPAIVTAVGAGTIALTIFAEDNRGGMCKDGVRHVDDPWFKEHGISDNGCWDYAPLEKRLRAVERMIDEMLREREGPRPIAPRPK